MLEHASLEAVYIYFDTATYDEIERDVKVVNIKRKLTKKEFKVTMEAALGLIGGTMGLLTGFSILSGFEIIFHILKLVLSLRAFSDTLHIVSVPLKKRPQNHCAL